MFSKNGSWIAAVVVSAGLLSAGCFLGDGGAEEADFENVREGLNDAAEGLGEAAEAMREALGEMAEGLSAGGVVEAPLNFRVLRDLLPEEVGEFTRRSREGKTEGALGFVVSAVEARYEDGEGGRIEVGIVDVGALPVVAMMGIVDWMNVDVEEESDRGWKRTLTFEGYPALEEFRGSDSDRGRAEFTYFVEQRFVVTLEGRNVSMDDVLDFRDEIGTDELADMKDREGRSDDDRRDRDRGDR